MSELITLSGADREALDEIIDALKGNKPKRALYEKLVRIKLYLDAETERDIAYERIYSAVIRYLTSVEEGRTKAPKTYKHFCDAIGCDYHPSVVGVAK